MKVAQAPGRVNLVGEHTDYNDGFVLPMAIDRYISAAYSSRSDRQIHVYAVDLDAYAVVELDRLGETPSGTWNRYVAAVAWVMQEAGEELSGANVVLHGEIPIGAGLSSSAALELAIMRALSELSDIEWDAERMALLARRAENEFVGVACGIMDQYVVAVPETPAALLLDCRSLAHEQVEVPDDAMIFVLDTGVRRKLSKSVFSERVRQCSQAADLVRGRNGHVAALRDVSQAELEAARPEMPDLLYRRAKHVVDETLRPAQMADAFRNDDLTGAGDIMQVSHASLRDLYEVSSPELDLMVELACDHDACFGARLTGAGLGGCAIALVHRDDHGDFADWILRSYRQHFAHPSAVYACRPATGAHLL